MIYEVKQDDDQIIINKLRVHFFFTEDGSDENFWKFLCNTEIEIKLTDGPYWEGQMIGLTNGYPL